MRVFGKYGDMGFELHKVNDLIRERAHYAFFSPTGNQLTEHHDKRKNYYYIQSRVGGRANNGGKLIRFGLYPVMCATFHGQAPTDTTYDAIYKPMHRRSQRQDIEQLAERLHNPYTIRWLPRSEILRIEASIEFAILETYEIQPDMTYQQMADRFNVHINTIQKILKRYGAIA